MDTRPIGVFDSGLGGLTAVGSLRQILPEEANYLLVILPGCPMAGRSERPF